MHTHPQAARKPAVRKSPDAKAAAAAASAAGKGVSWASRREINIALADGSSGGAAGRPQSPTPSHGGASPSAAQSPPKAGSGAAPKRSNSMGGTNVVAPSPSPRFEGPGQEAGGSWWKRSASAQLQRMASNAEAATKAEKEDAGQEQYRRQPSGVAVISTNGGAVAGGAVAAGAAAAAATLQLSPSKRHGSSNGTLPHSSSSHLLATGALVAADGLLLSPRQRLLSPSTTLMRRQSSQLVATGDRVVEVEDGGETGRASNPGYSRSGTAIR